MAYTSLTSPSPIGWNKWIYVKDFYQNIIFSDAAFPPTYIPSSTAWISQILSNCLFPWINTHDLFFSFMLGGGASGTLNGSLGGLSVVGTLQTIPQSAVFGIGKYPPGGPAPQICYCIGNAFKQNVYTKLATFNSPGFGVVVTDTIVELLQNCKYKRAYVNHGEVVNYSVLNNKHILTLDFTSTNDSPDQGTIYGQTTMKITSSNVSAVNRTYDVGVDDITSNWQIVISDPGPDNVPQPGDFYQFNTTWCMEDPYLLSGFWKGLEDTSAPSSGLGLYVTSHNVPYCEGQILGTYIWKVASTTVTSSTTTLPGASPASTILQQPPPGYTMADVGGNTWAFFSFGRHKSDVYPDDTRYKENVLQTPDDDGNITSFLPRDPATIYDYNALIADRKTTYLRVEISTGGNSYRHNWHAPCLKGSYLKMAGKLFKILDQVDSNTIDVSITSVDLTSKYNPYNNEDYSIINQSAWFINEHYDGNSDFSHDGVFNGIISGSGTDYTIQVNGDDPHNWVKFNGLSFIDRYKQTIQLSTYVTKKYTKFQNWKVVKKVGDVEYLIKNVTFLGSPTTYSDPYQIKIELESSTNELSGEEVSICFNDGFDTVGNVSRTAYSYIVEATPYSDRVNSGFILTDKLCFNGEYLSVPYEIDVPANTRIGFCGDLYFGLEVGGKACPLTLVSTLRSARGVASLFHTIRQEDWIAYMDKSTNKLTIRRGSLDFQEYPMKTEVAIGKPSLVETKALTGKQLSLNTTQDRIRRIQIEVPDIPTTGVYHSLDVAPDTTVTNSDYIFVTINSDSMNKVYGFLISGLGTVNLVALQRMGMKEGNVASNTWTYNGTDVSPVYIYKKSSFQNLRKMSIDIGMDTNDNDTIFLQGGTIDSAIVQYSYDNQTIEENGLFDIVRLADGENLVLYSIVADQFNVEGQLNNSNVNSTRWNNSNAIMAIGTFNDSFCWGTPLKKGFTNNNDVYPIMLLNSVDYLACIYNRNNNTLAIFCRCYKNKKPYVGCLVVAIRSIIDAPNYLCTHPSYNASNPSATPLNFLWRPPLVTYASDANRSWTDSSNLIKITSSTLPNLTLNEPNDDFVRVMGPAGFNCQFENSKEIGITSASILDDGTYVFFYDSDAGVKAVFSNNCGISWAGNNNISFARNAVAGLWLGNSYFFYITPQGIEMANITMGDMSYARDIDYKKKAGINVTSEEETLQSTLDTTKRFLIGSGAIDYQRLSGYITSTGIIKLFYYGSNNVLMSMESEDGFKWKYSSNF